MAAWKRTRDQGALTRAIRTLYQNAKKGDRFNLMPSIIEAVSVYATAGETIGVIRKARGLAYDPFNVIECPFELA
jgi:methylmalonyl-CoA mutase N-terminal domain/subunit